MGFLVELRVCSCETALRQHMQCGLSVAFLFLRTAGFERILPALFNAVILKGFVIEWESANGLSLLFMLPPTLAAQVAAQVGGISRDSAAMLIYYKHTTRVKLADAAPLLKAVESYIDFSCSCRTHNMSTGLSGKLVTCG